MITCRTTFIKAIRHTSLDSTFKEEYRSHMYMILIDNSMKLLRYKLSPQTHYLFKINLLNPLFYHLQFCSNERSWLENSSKTSTCNAFKNWNLLSISEDHMRSSHSRRACLRFRIINKALHKAILCHMLRSSHTPNPFQFFLVYITELSWERQSVANTPNYHQITYLSIEVRRQFPTPNYLPPGKYLLFHRK